MTLGEKILYCRKRLGLSQEALAERLGVSRQAVSKWETGEAVPELGKLVLLSKAFGVTTDWLLSEEEAPQQAESQPAQPRQENGYPSWLDDLPGFLARAIKRYGWLYGVRMAIGGVLFAGIGLLARVISKQMFSGFDGMFGSPFYEADLAMGFGTDAVFTNYSVSNPVYTMGGVIAAFGAILIIAGVIIAVVLKRYSKDQ